MYLPSKVVKHESCFSKYKDLVKNAITRSAMAKTTVFNLSFSSLFGQRVQYPRSLCSIELIKEEQRMKPKFSDL